MAEKTNDVVLKVAGISKRFGGLQALSDVGITIQRGQVYGLIGPNGAGKTTFFNVITGLYTPDSGTFELAGKPYEPTAVHEVAKAGIASTFQNIRLFAEMTALENVMVGRHIRTNSGLLGAVLRTKSFKEEEAAIAKRAQELLDYGVMLLFAINSVKRCSSSLIFCSVKPVAESHKIRRWRREGSNIHSKSSSANHWSTLRRFWYNHCKISWPRQPLG